MAAPSLPERRARFAATTAPQLAAAAGGPRAPWAPAHRLSTRFAFFADDERLLVVCGPQEPPPAVDLALAYGLGLSGDRDLVLVLPAGSAAPTVSRAAWIDVPLALWVHDGRGARPVAVPARVEVLARYDDPLERTTHALGERGAWVARLIDWADADEDLVAAHRSRYLAWHCEGRLVLRIRRTQAGLQASAGVHHAEPGPGRPAPTVEVLDGPLTAAGLHRLVAAAAGAAADRLAARDARHGEHRLQARLPGLLRRLGLRGARREFPALRASGQRGYIDFLAIDARERIHVVETKIGPDETLVLQGLDYWIWAVAHADELAAAFDLPTPLRVALDFVVAGDAGSAPVGPYSAPQAEALHGAVPWRFHVVDGWATDEPAITSLPIRTAPPGPRYATERFAGRLHRHLVDAAGQPLVGGVFWPDAADGLLPAARRAYEALADDRLLHRMIGHVRSSQAFALNLFAPLDETARLAVLTALGLDCVTAEEAIFEWVDPLDALAERTPASPHQTQVDVLLRGADARGRTHAALVEVKLSELDFGHCSAYQRAENDARDVCLTDGSFGGEPQRCFQLRNHDGTQRRRYDEHLDALHAPPRPAGCWWRTGRNQPMRNVALARALAARGGAATATYALCAHDANPTIWRRWAEATATFAAGERVRLAALRASTVVALHPTADAEILRARYRL